MCQKNIFTTYVDLLLVGEERKRHYVLIKNFNTYIYDHTLYHARKSFYCYYLQVFSTAEVLKMSC